MFFDLKNSGKQKPLYTPDIIFSLMGLISWIRERQALKRAKEEEKKEIPTDKDILEGQKKFLKEAKELKSAITKPGKKTKKKKPKK